MRTLIAVLTLATLMSVCPRRGAADEPKAAPGEGAQERFHERIVDLNLTHEQETRIADIRKEHHPKVQEAARELHALVKEEVDKARAVLTPEQVEKVHAMKEEWKERRCESLAERIAHFEDLDLTEGEMTKIAEIRREYRPKVEKAFKEMTGILTDDQKKAREEALKAGKSRREVLTSLNLTDEQREKLTAACKDVGAVVREEMEKIRDVLSAEQQEKLAELREERRERVRDRAAHAIAHFRDLNLTEDQKTRLTEIRHEYRPKIHEAGNKLRGAVREELEMIAAVIKA